MSVLAILAMRKPWQIGIQDFFGEHRFLIAFFAYHARDGRHLEVQSRGFEANEWRRGTRDFCGSEGSKFDSQRIEQLFQASRQLWIQAC